MRCLRERLTTSDSCQGKDTPSETTSPLGCSTGMIDKLSVCIQEPIRRLLCIVYQEGHREVEDQPWHIVRPETPLSSTESTTARRHKYAESTEG